MNNSKLDIKKILDFNKSVQSLRGASELQDDNNGIWFINYYNQDDQKRLGIKDNKNIYYVIQALEGDTINENKIDLKFAIFISTDDYFDEDYLRINKMIRRPLTIHFENDFFYDPKAKTISNSKGVILSPRQVLDLIYNEHIKPLRVTGIIGNFKLYLHKRHIYRIRRRRSIFGKLHHIFTGIQLDLMLMSNNTYLNLEVKELSKSEVSIAGIKAPYRVAVIFALIHLIILFIQYFKIYSFPFLKFIFDTSIYTLVYSILFIGVVDRVIPRILIELVKINKNHEKRIIFEPLKTLK